MHKIKGFIYTARVILSLLDGKWKTAPEIAREWHDKTATPTIKPYEKECKELSNFKKLKSRKKYPKSKRIGIEYSLNLSELYIILAKMWKIKQTPTLQLLKSPSFQKWAEHFVKSLKKPIPQSGEIRLLNEFYFFYPINELDKELWYKIGESRRENIE